jgi:hypothetical protein
MKLEITIADDFAKHAKQLVQAGGMTLPELMREMGQEELCDDDRVSLAYEHVGDDSTALGGI